MIDNALLVIVVYLASAAVMSLASIIAMVAIMRYQVKTAGRIAADITSGLSGRIERSIKRDIDSGTFFY